LTNSDFVTGAPAGTTEASLGTISVVPGSRIKQINVSGRTFIGTITQVRLEAPGLKTPMKFNFPTVYEATGTEVQYASAWSQPPIDVDIPVPPTCNSITVYAIVSVNATPVAVGLVWE
jgi:hypothetical protein